MQTCSAHALEHYQYRQTTGNDRFDFSWELTVSQNNVLRVRGNGEYYENICDDRCRTVG
ncbi:MAG: hypothetical protein R2860_05150 [Desulfobacterales bacterium]